MESNVLYSESTDLSVNSNRLTDLENKLMITGGKWGMRDRLGVRDSHVPTAIFKIDNQQAPIA